MSPAEWGVLAFGYALLGVLVGVIAGTEIGDHAPADEAPAIGFICGLLWPLIALAAILWLAFLGIRGLARSFAALSRRLRPTPAWDIPKAVAKERQ